MRGRDLLGRIIVDNPANWVLISGQNGEIQVGNICTMDKSESELAPVLRYVWDYMIETQKV